MHENDKFINKQIIFYKLLEKIINDDNHVQAYILSGDSKNLIQKYAIMLSKALICNENYNNDCKKCNICYRIDNNCYSELKIINPVNDIIKKEEIIEVKKMFKTESLEGKHNIYIINDVECLNQASANSILKFLEEPEGDVIAIFTTTNINDVIETIISRCQIINIKNEEEKTGLEYVIEVSGLSVENINIILDYIKEIETNYSFAISKMKLDYLDIFNTKQLLSSSLMVFLLLYKDVLAYKSGLNEFCFDLETIKTISNLNSENIITKKISIILDNINKIKNNVNTSLFLSNLLIRMGELKYDKSSRS